MSASNCTQFKNHINQFGLMTTTVLADHIVIYAITNEQVLNKYDTYDKYDDVRLIVLLTADRRDPNNVWLI